MPNFEIGQDKPSLRGSEDVKNVQKRSYSTYNQTNRGSFTNQFIEANDANKNYSSFIRSNKFDYGYDPNGGHRALSMDKAGTSKNVDGWTRQDRENFKQKDLKQNFEIKSTQKMMNSETKKIGDTLDRFVKNEIDQDFLKRSHLPFAHVKAQMAQNQRPGPINSNFARTIGSGG